MENVISRLLDRWDASQRSRKILVNIGLFFLAVLSFATANPIFELGPIGLQWAAFLAFLGNALAGIATIPNRQIPVGYRLIQDGPNSIYRLEKVNTSNWLGMILSSLRATDSLINILVNVGIAVGLVLVALTDNGILSGELPKVITAVAFFGNALADMAHVPANVVPEGYDLFQDAEGDFYIQPVAVTPTDDPTDFATRAISASPSAVKFNF